MLRIFDMRRSRAQCTPDKEKRDPPESGGICWFLGSGYQRCVRDHVYGMYSGQYAASAELTMTFTSASDMSFPCSFPKLITAFSL